MLIFWGLTRSKIDFSFLYSSFIYFVIIFITLIIALIYASFVFNNSDDKSLFLASSLVGNTGNLGIPLGIALFGISSVPYTSILNLSNIFFIYIFSVFFFAGNKFSLKKSLKDILKIPAIGFAVLALLFNYFDFTMSKDFDQVFTMAAYAAIVMQLIVFGIFLSQIQVKSLNWKLSLNIVLFKHFVLPFVALVCVLYFEVNKYLAAIIFLELMVPLAVNNINLASLYNKKPLDATFSVLLSTFVFIVLIYFYILISNYFFGV